MIENFKTFAGNQTGIGAILSYTFTDGSGKPLADASVREANTVTDNGKVIERSNSIKTDAKGMIYDVVMKGGSSENMPGAISDLKSFLNKTPITFTSSQTLTITSAGKTYSGTSTRTLTNVGANGKLNAKHNSHGVNFTISFTTPAMAVSQ